MIRKRWLRIELWTGHSGLYSDDFPSELNYCEKRKKWKKNKNFHGLCCLKLLLLNQSLFWGCHSLPRLAYSFFSSSIFTSALQSFSSSFFLLLQFFLLPFSFSRHASSSSFFLPLSRPHPMPLLPQLWPPSSFPSTMITTSFFLPLRRGHDLPPPSPPPQSPSPLLKLRHSLLSPTPICVFFFVFMVCWSLSWLVFLLLLVSPAFWC